MLPVSTKSSMESQLPVLELSSDYVSSPVAVPSNRAF